MHKPCIVQLHQLAQSQSRQLLPDYQIQTRWNCWHLGLSWVVFNISKKKIFTKCNHSCTAPVLRAERGLISISISNAPVQFLYLFRTTIRMLQVSILLLLPLGTSGLALNKQSGWPHPHVPYRFPSRTNERLSESFSSLHLELGEWSKIYRIYSLARNRRRITRTEDRGSAHENVIMQIGI